MLPLADVYYVIRPAMAASVMSMYIFFFLVIIS